MAFPGLICWRGWSGPVAGSGNIGGRILGSVTSTAESGRAQVSHHILPTSANLLGLCFLLLSLMKVTKASFATLIDECVGVAIIVFLAASIFSYMSIRTASERADRFERIADVIFLSGLGLLAIVAMIIVLEFI